MGRDKALYARGKRGDLVCAMQTWSPRLWSTNWRASTFVFDKLGRQFMQRCARIRIWRVNETVMGYLRILTAAVNIIITAEQHGPRHGLRAAAAVEGKRLHWHGGPRWGR